MCFLRGSRVVRCRLVSCLWCRIVWCRVVCRLWCCGLVVCFVDCGVVWRCGVCFVRGVFLAPLARRRRRRRHDDVEPDGRGAQGATSEQVAYCMQTIKSWLSLQSSRFRTVG